MPTGQSIEGEVLSGVAAEGLKETSSAAVEAVKWLLKRHVNHRAICSAPAKAHLAAIDAATPKE